MMKTYPFFKLNFFRKKRGNSRSAGLLLLFVAGMLNSRLEAQPLKTLEVFTQKPTVTINPSMWGVFFEDISFSADALMEAAFMTGLERNADVVTMAAYAPLFAHVDAWQWRPYLIWFDNLLSVGTPNYYVQKFFSNYKGTTVVPILQGGKVVAGTDSIYASATMDDNSHSLIIKVANTSSQPAAYTIVTDNKKISGSGTMQVLTSGDKSAINTLDQPFAITPKELVVKVSAGKMPVTLAPCLLM